MKDKQIDKSRKISTAHIQLQLRQRMRDLREDHDLRQWEVADILQIDRSTYAHYELGSTRPDYEMLIKLAQFYGVSVDYLLGVK